MLINHISILITKYLGFSPTKGQKTLIRILSEFIVNSATKEILLIKGYAGTGKTSTISSMVKAFKELKIKSVLLAPTGRAAKVLMNYSGKNAFTIHKKIYRQKSAKDGFGEFILDRNLHKNTFFIVDEASMINNYTGNQSIFGSGRLLDDLIEYVYNSNCKLILTGDTAQLPPVHLDVSPALNKDILKDYGINVIEIELTEVVRQESDSGILYNATKIRQYLNNNLYQLSFELGNFKDICRLSGNELIESINDSISRFGIEDVIVLCRSNKRANQYNKGIRSQILYREAEIEPGDLLMVVKNNYYGLNDYSDIDFIANGDIIEVLKIHHYHTIYNYRFADITLRLMDYNNIEIRTMIMLDTLDADSPALPGEKNKELFYTIAEDYTEIKSKKKRFLKVKEDKYFNALQVKFAYAVTCHKSQGGQWKTVYIDQGYLTDNMINKEYLRWIYTALTRAKENVYLVNFNDKYFIS